MRTVVLVASLVTTVAHADAVELGQFLESAEQQNLDRKLARETHHRTVQEFQQAWMGLLPTLTAQGTWTHNQYEAVASLPDGMGGAKKLVISPADQLDAIFRIDLPLVDTARWFRTITADLAEDSSSEKENVTADVVKRQIVGSYYGYAAALALRDSAKKSVAAAEAQEKIIAVRANVGTVTNLDLLRARAELQRNKQVLADTENLVAVSRRTLQTLSGLTPGEAVKLPEVDLHAETAFPELEKRLEELPAVKAATKDQAVVDTVSRSAKLALVPTLGAQFTERFTNATGFQGQGALYNLGLNLNWRLDVSSFAAMDVQNTNSTLAALALEKVRTQARDQLYSDFQAFEAAKTKIESAAAQVEAAQKAAEITRDRYTAGAATQNDVIQSERDLFSAEVGQIQAKTSLAQARAALHLSAALPVQ